MLSMSTWRSCDNLWRSSKYSAACSQSSSIFRAIRAALMAAYLMHRAANTALHSDVTLIYMNMEPISGLHSSHGAESIDQKLTNMTMCPLVDLQLPTAP